MNDTSPILSMPYIQPSQAQKHVTHNEALRLLDVIVQLVVASSDLNTPPPTAVQGDRYLVAANGQADWAGQDHKIAVFDGFVWAFTAPQQGWQAYVSSDSATLIFDGTLWAEQGLENLQGLGVNAASDATNRFVVSSDAVLLNNAGAGHQVKVNKAATTDTASLLFQTGFSGRAEMGTTGDDDFSIKVSADGSTWAEALRIEAATGRVLLGVSRWREMLEGPRTYYVNTALGDDAQDGTAPGPGAFSTVHRAVEALKQIDSGGHDITVQLADGTYTLSQVLRLDTPLIGGGRVILLGNTTTPSDVTLEAGGDVIAVDAGQLVLRGLALRNTGAASRALAVGAGATVALDDVVFGSAGGHIEVTGGRLLVEGAYGIDGGADTHLVVAEGGVFVGNGHVVTLTGTPSFGTAYLVCRETGVAKMAGQSFSGSATGVRFVVSTNAIVDTNASGLGFLPGDQAGTVQTGGIYA